MRIACDVQNRYVYLANTNIIYSKRAAGWRRWFLHSMTEKWRREREKTRTLFARLLLRQIYVNSRLTKCLFASHFYLLRNRHVIRGGRTGFFFRLFLFLFSAFLCRLAWTCGSSHSSYTFIYFPFFFARVIRELTFCRLFRSPNATIPNFFVSHDTLRRNRSQVFFHSVTFWLCGAARREQSNEWRENANENDANRWAAVHTVELSRRRRRRRIHRFWAHCAQYATTKRNQDRKQTENEINMNLILEYFSWHFAFSLSFVDNLLLVLQFSAGFCRFCHYP